MEVIISYTSTWDSPVFGTLTTEVTESISIIRCNELYIIMRVTELGDGNNIPIETKYTKSYAMAAIWYEEWKSELMSHI